ACVSSGAGKTTLLISEGMLSAINSSLPGAMTSIIDDAAVTIDLTIHPYNVVAVGPGMGTDNIAQERLYSILTKFRGSLVLDADALNILSQNKGWLKLLPPNSILTPHPAEFARLFGEVDNSLEAFNLQQEMSDKYQIVIIRKGANSSITFPGEKIWFNTSGNPALAKGGTGDILTGVIAGLLAQGYTAKEAALFATWLHGKAADEAIRSVGIEAADSSDIIDGIKRVFKQLNML
ncbi:MAG TPA: NAD(P)H-hydrate dehydratase, partial [Bacteroidales bacterium]|nr:NAD(P)H-hydrate dehydratase [Bacteroidales bacterium]